MVSSHWCPAEEDDSCGSHHQSPINLERNRASQNHPLNNECIDIHWMACKYLRIQHSKSYTSWTILTAYIFRSVIDHDSSCDFETLREKKAFTVERHALKITQPLESTGAPDAYQLACKSPKGARTWGKIDFSRGFSQWWHLSHVDFHVPSEHTQEGKRYSGEIQMYHWYSVNATVAGIHNEVSHLVRMCDILIVAVPRAANI